MAVDFEGASRDLVELVARVNPARLDGPGLGVWTLRELIGHTSRAVSTLSTYLAEPEPDAATIATAEEYLHAMLSAAGADDAIAERGRATTAALGEDLVAALTGLRDDTLTALAHAAPTRVIGIGGVAMPLGEYLRTRVFELTVHGLDIAAAAGLEWQPAPEHLTDALALATANAVDRGQGVEALRILTGREPSTDLRGVLNTPPAN